MKPIFIAIDIILLLYSSYNIGKCGRDRNLAGVLANIFFFILMGLALLINLNTL